jgi:hypothetical protein
MLEWLNYLLYFRTGPQSKPVHLENGLNNILLWAVLEVCLYSWTALSLCYSTWSTAGSEKK